MSPVHLKSNFSWALKQAKIHLLILLLAATPASLLAQTQEGSDNLEAEDANESEEANQQLPVVVISASRSPLPAKQVGSSVSVFLPEEIRHRQIKFIDELLREVPGVAVNQTSGRGSLTGIRIRGSEANHTLFQIDGMELNDPAPYSVFQLQLLPAGLIERVEVLRGPQSSLYGGESIGGVVSMTTPTPEDGMEGFAEVQLGSRDSTEANLNLGYGSEDGYASLSHSAFKTDGFPRTDQNSDPDGYRNKSTILKAGSNLSGNVSVSATGLFIDAEVETDGSSPQQDFEKSIQKFSLDYDSPNETVSHKFSITKGNHKRFDKYATSVGRTTGKSNKYEYQGQVKFPDSDSNLVYAIEQESGFYVNESPFASTNQKISPTTSYILEWQSVVGDSLFVSLSGRHDDNSKNRFSNYNTYRATMAYVLGDGSSRLHSSVGTGIKNPNPIELYGYGESFVGNPDLTPETSQSWDIGYEFPAGSANSSVDITYFNNKIDNFINTIWGKTSSGSFAPIKAENSPLANTINGLELAYNSVVAGIYDTSISLTQSNAKDSDGVELIRRPSTKISVNVRRPVSMGGYQGSMNVNVQHTGDFQDTNFDVFPSVPVTLPSRTLLNFAGSLNMNENAQAIFKVENLFDKDDYQEVYGFNVPGRSIFAGMKFSY